MTTAAPTPSGTCPRCGWQTYFGLAHLCTTVPKRDGGRSSPLTTPSDRGDVNHFDWALCDPDAPVGTTYRTGVGFETLVEALRDLACAEAEQTPEGFYPSGNVALYWSRKVRS